MTMLSENDVLLIIVDIQERLLNSVFNKEIVSKNAGIISKASKILKLPVLITEQYPKGLGNTIPEIKENVEALYKEKITFSALENDEILNEIMSSGKRQILICGIETHICVNQTVQALLARGLEVFVLKDCCGSRAESEYFAGLERMKALGANILTTEIALFELLRSAKHPEFKNVQALIK